MRAQPSTACLLCVSITASPLNVCERELGTLSPTRQTGETMADEDDELPQDEAPEEPQRLFTLTEAERARREVEPFLVEAMECRKKLSGLDNDLSAVAARIMMMGGVVVPYESLARLRHEHTKLAENLRSSLDRILETGCIIKDLEVGLLDFPSIIDNEEVYLCWKLGEDRIRYYHRQDEGFAGRKPLDPRDPGSSDTVQ
jgi:hypothetical protein